LDFGTSYKKSRKVPIKIGPCKSCEKNDLKEIKMKNIDYLHLIWIYENSDH
jgi:hypothetical protein